MHEMHGMKDESLEEHVSKHVSYPATKAQILQSCMTEGFSAEETKMGGAKLKEKTYQSAEEAMKDLRGM